MGILGNVASTLLNPKKFTDTVNNGLQMISSQKSSNPSDIASDSNKFIASKTPGTQLIKGAMNGYQNGGGLSGAVNGAADSVKNMKDGLIGSNNGTPSSIVPPTLNNSSNNQIGTISPQRTNNQTTNNNYSIGKYLKKQQCDFGIKDKWNKLSTKSKIGIGVLGAAAGLYATDKLGDFVKSKLPGGNTTNSSVSKASTVSDNTSFNKEFLNDNKGIADTYTVDKSKYINANGELDTASMNRDQSYLTKQFNNEFENYKNHMKIADPDRYNKISSNESLAKSAKISSSFDKLKSIPKPLLYGAGIGGSALIYSKIKDDRRR